MNSFFLFFLWRARPVLKAPPGLLSALCALQVSVFVLDHRQLDRRGDTGYKTCFIYSGTSLEGNVTLFQALDQKVF